jgi:hypothetical protein
MRKLLVFIVSISMCSFSKGEGVPKYVSEVYNKVFNSISNGEVSKPKLVLIDDLKSEKKAIADYSPSKGTITIGQSLIELTRKFGIDSSNARAHIFSHELAHLFLNHGYASVIGTGFASKEMNIEFKKAKLSLEDNLGELEADQWAFFYAYISGYKTKEVVPKLLDTIYKYYKLNDGLLNNYPKLSERKKYAKDAYVKMKSMCEAYDFANLSLIHGDFKLSIAIYEAIRNEGFKSREIFSNLGLANLLSSLKNKGYPEIDFVLPLQIDLDTRLNQDGTRGLGDQDDTDEQINIAIENFNKAIKIDPEYFIGYFNLAITSWLKNDGINLELNLERAKKLMKADQNDIVSLFESIMRFKSTDSKTIQQGLKEIESLSKKGNALATLNLNLINKVEIEVNQEKKYPEFITKNFDFKNLPTNFKESKNILDSTFYKLAIGNEFSCKEVVEKITYRRWKFKKGEQYLIGKQYIFDNNSYVLTDKDKLELIAGAKTVFELDNGLYLVFGDLILKIDLSNILNVQIIKN